MSDDTAKRNEEGARRRDVGMAFAAARRPDRVTLGRLAFLQALLISPDGTATIDDATATDELTAGYADGGRWRGSVTRTIVADGFAEIIGATRSTRPSRHRGYVSTLRLTDREAARTHIARLTAALSINNATPPAATDGVDTLDTTKNTDQGDSSNDQTH